MGTNSAIYTATQAGAVTTSDTVAITPNPRALYIGVGGDVVLVPVGQTAAVTFKNVPTGTVLPVQTLRVNATSTTATNIVALY